MALPDSSDEEIANLFKVLSKPETLRILLLADRGIGNSTYAIEELEITQKMYYSRLSGLVELGLVNKIDGAYRQTPLGQIICSRLLPAIECIFDSKDKLSILELLEGTAYEDKLKKVFAEELKALELFGYNGVKVIQDYESLAIEAIDMSDSAEKSILLASNYFDVRVMEATIRAVDRGVTNRIIAGKKSINSKMKQLKMMLSISFTKSLMTFFSNSMDLKDLCRFVDIPYTFCIVDGHLILIEISTIIDGSFMIAFSFDDKDVGKKLTDLFETLWDLGESNTGLKFLDNLKS